MSGINYEGGLRKSAKIRIHPRSEFKAILKIFNAIKFPESGIPDEQISFAILELVSNSMRAQSERERDETIVVRIWIEGDRMMVTVSDHGGGFDPASLPYALAVPVESLNLMSPDFLAYRQKFNNSRFGMGLVAVRKIFPVFAMEFVDGSDAKQDWPSPSIEGTKITLGLPIKD